MSRNLDGNLCRFNPDLTLNAQIQVLEYKRNIFEISRERFDPGMIIGQGQFGTVGLGTLITDSGRREKVAVKQAKNHGDRSQWLSIIDELKILSQLERNYSLVNLVGANTLDFQSMGKLYLLLEYCPHGDMKTFLGKNRRNFSPSPISTPGRVENEFNMSLLFTWSYSIAHGMNYLASKKIMHGDLAARNILIGAGYEAKISDFGLSKMMYYNEDYKKTERKMIPWA
ncbi:platelet-derived growth factor receptor alpha [Eurytemora carolleeae]|uniref:platelet-derived growth factor receptor alpha n=1 Tax=Eurytemora carolleeae TaxID=1294199 RepID=UPI000C790A25|nr:platelet-derived growth factor receptor alpha [Eurytemora carolleeae]|eukprot:XP_023326587.1 platelet-derived growth factor receptor alpha-like [Eurytemora affinis]